MTNHDIFIMHVFPTFCVFLYPLSMVVVGNTVVVDVLAVCVVDVVGPVFVVVVVVDYSMFVVDVDFNIFLPKEIFTLSIYTYQIIGQL